MPQKATAQSGSHARLNDGDTFPVSAWTVIAAWTVPAVLTAFESLMLGRAEGRPVSVWQALVSGFAGWYVWAACTPLIARLARRFPLTRPVRWRAVATHVVAFLAVTLAASVAWAAAAAWARPVRFTVALGNWFIAGLPFALLVYAAVVGIFYSVVDRARLRVGERDAARLAQQLSEAQLSSLRMQLQPHFLFNSLNAIMALVRDGESSRALDAIELLGDMLRLTLRTGQSHEVALAEEVAFTRRYLEMEQLRFAERLRVAFDVTPELIDAAVPPFVLQPLVENAIKHGILDRRQGGTITISALAAGGRLRLSVRDDGVGLAPGWNDGRRGVGIDNARTRLAHLYGDAAALDVRPGPEGIGVEVEITLPYRRHLLGHADTDQLPRARSVYADTA